jgi:hypothetical protein
MTRLKTQTVVAVVSLNKPIPSHLRKNNIGAVTDTLHSI